MLDMIRLSPATPRETTRRQLSIYNIKISTTLDSVWKLFVIIALSMILRLIVEL